MEKYCVAQNSRNFFEKPYLKQDKETASIFLETRSTVTFDCHIIL